jgi:hypothetical protein
VREGCKIAALVRHDRPHCMVAGYAPGILRMADLLLGLRGRGISALSGVKDVWR